MLEVTKIIREGLWLVSRLTLEGGRATMNLYMWVKEDEMYNTL